MNKLSWILISLKDLQDVAPGFLATGEIELKPLG